MKYAQAEEIFKAVLDVQTATLAPDHALTLTTKNNLAAVYSNQGKNAQAEELIKVVIKARTAKEKKPKKVSAIDAAARVLGEAKEPMNCQELIKAMADKGYWTSPGGKTPHATLYSAMLREIDKKGKDARFTKTERGKFAANS